jgi:hypothetical protein
MSNRGRNMSSGWRQLQWQRRTLMGGLLSDACRVDVGIHFRSCSQMSFALPSRWRCGHIRADSEERIPVGLFWTNLERWISTGSSHRVLVKDGKHAVAKPSTSAARARSTPERE